MELIHTEPDLSIYTPVSQFQSETPTSFSASSPILYIQSPSCTLLVTPSDLVALPILRSLAAESAQLPENVDSTTSDDLDDQPEIQLPGVDIIVASVNVTLWSPARSTGITLPYPSITLHALSLSPPSVYLQLLKDPSHTFDDHDPDTTVAIKLLPSPSFTAPTFTDTTTTNGTTDPPASTAHGDRQQDIPDTAESEAKRLYEALSSCADLHPDADLDGENDIDMDNFDDGAVLPLATGGDGGLPPPMPGSGGWITAENVDVEAMMAPEAEWRGDVNHQHHDNVGGRGAGEEGLGAGAGTVRPREDEDQGGLVDGNGDGGAKEGGVDGEEADGAGGEETKWRRTS